MPARFFFIISILRITPPDDINFCLFVCRFCSRLGSDPVAGHVRDLPCQSEGIRQRRLRPYKLEHGFLHHQDLSGHDGESSQESQKYKLYQQRFYVIKQEMVQCLWVMILNVNLAGFSYKRWDLLALFLYVLHQCCLHHGLCPRDKRQNPGADWSHFSGDIRPIKSICTLKKKKKVRKSQAFIFWKPPNWLASYGILYSNIWYVCSKAGKYWQ